jgi:hypothetical protein
MHLLNKRLAVAAAGFVAALALFIPSLQGGEADLRTVFNMSHPFTVPGTVLEPNTDYVIMVGDAHTGTRRVVRIYNEDESELLSMFLAVNDERTERAEKTTFTFIEMDEGQPQVVRSWFYPGRSIGLEFVYPKDQALEIAQHAKETVLATEVDLAALDNEKGIDVDADLSDLEGIDVVAVEPGTVTAERTATVTEDRTIVSEPVPAPEASIESESQSAATLPEEPVVAPRADGDVPEANDSRVEMPADGAVVAQNEEPADLKADSEISREKTSEQSAASQAQSDGSLESNGNELPSPAGTLPLLALAGGLSLGLGLGVRLLTVRQD